MKKTILLLAGIIFLGAGCAQDGPTPPKVDPNDKGSWIPDEGRTLLGITEEIAPDLDLPDQVFLKTRTETHNREYYFATRNGNIYAKKNEERTGKRTPWVRLNLPKDLDQRVLEIAADDINLMAINEDRKVFTMNGGLGPMKLFWWSGRWGTPIWLGPGTKLPEEIRDWTYTVISPGEDKKFTDPAGNRHAVGGAKVSHIWFLLDEGQTLRYIDPWLPVDYSYGAATPYRGRFKARALSASGSTLFIINRYGDMFTRFYDFDMAGCDPVFFRYSYKDQRDKWFPAIQLPCFDWVRQPKIDGLITDNISVYKVGKYGIHRILRVEGKNAEGETGFWQKDVTELTNSAWVFHPTGRPLEGTILENSAEDRSREDLADSTDADYTRPLSDGWSGMIEGLNCYDSPAPLVITAASGQTLELTLHTVDGLRQKAREPGFDDNPRTQYACIEVSPTLLQNEALPPELRKWVDDHLDGQFTSYLLYGTRDQAVLKKGSFLKGLFKTTGIEMHFSR